MAKSKQSEITDFWGGFALGATALALVSFLLGTKKGREFLKKALDITENLDDYVKHFIEEKGAQEFVETIKEKVEEMPNATGLGNVIDRIKDLTGKK